MILTGNNQRGRQVVTRGDDQRVRFLVDKFKHQRVALGYYSFIHLKIKYPDFLFAVSQFPNKFSSFAFVLGAPCFF